MKILLLSDATLCVDGGGICQTLYNIFLFTDPDNILCVTPHREHKRNPPSKPFENRYLTYRFEIIDTPRNRLAKYLDPVINRFNYTFNLKYRRFDRLRRQIKSFNPDIVISCSNGPVGLFMHLKLLKGLNIQKVFPYFMDDWMNLAGAGWLKNKIHQWAETILKESPRWLMISLELSEILAERYKVRPTGILEIHNPVNLSNAPVVIPVKQKERFTLAYAGALWDMHMDAFYVIAKGINQLRETRDIQLILYTSKDHWNWRRAELEPLGVIYGGSIPYNSIHKKLAEADALVLSSSFTKEYYTHSKASVQTKITDYLSSRRLIISCGPVYSANNNFMKKHHCGVCIETTDEVEVAARLKEIFDNVENYQPLINNGWDLLENEFTFSKVHKKLQYFLTESLT